VTAHVHVVLKIEPILRLIVQTRVFSLADMLMQASLHSSEVFMNFGYVATVITYPYKGLFNRGSDSYRIRAAPVIKRQNDRFISSNSVGIVITDF